MSKEPWKLHIGIHSGSRMSRDCWVHSVSFDDPCVPLSSLSDCKDTFIKWKRNYVCLGYFIWYAYAKDPVSGEKHELDSGTPYRR